MGNEHERGESTAFILGMAFGLIAGSVAALWMAPRSGRATRARLRQQTEGVVGLVQGESIEDAIELGKAIAHQKKGEAAQSAHY